MSEDVRSPLKRKPLRSPGQSVQDRHLEILLDQLLLPWVAIALLFGFAVNELARWYFQTPPVPGLAFAVAGGALIYALFRTPKVLKELRQLRQARDGEKAVGQFLEGLRRDGHVIFHDLLASGFNVDHVIVGPKGVFTVETKTWSKPASGEPRIEFDGETLRAAGWLPSRDPIVQGKAQAKWLAEILEETTGRRFPVRPVILFPGWYIDQPKGTSREVWVLNPKALPTFLEHEADQLAAADVALVSTHLSKFIRAGLDT